MWTKYYGTCLLPQMTFSSLRLGRIVTGASTASSQGIRLSFVSPFHDEMNQELVVEPNGKVLTRVAGPLDAAGLTIEELSQMVLTRSSETLRDPEVLVTLVGFALKQIYISGEVGRPRAIEYREGITPLHAISEAGGFLYTARMDSVILIRKGQTADDMISRKLDLGESG